MATPLCVISKQTGTSSSSQQQEIHSIPCKIDYNGPAKVSGYFSQDEDSNGKKRAAFRGHGLEGVTLDLPPGYELCVLKKRGEMFDIESRQRSFTLWEWDREAGKRSAAARALSQLKIAHALADD
ncbi:ribonuclease H1/H2 small subunit [Ancylostoma caninum]|uniref:Ribonuclease H1/H2 small subunit n=1 Tax=Ancylostoma caninum TaxID=29170 RepID=A0A368FBG9_ANCCA|nr:ribonuclease H1/H2 small subunit [Ancylostoma caninum]